MRTYLLKRFLLIPITMLGITFITFMVMKLAPGDPAQALKQQISGGNVKAEQTNRKAMEEWRKERHLDEPLHKQYGYWLRDLSRFDLGRSFMPPREKVSDLIIGKFDRDSEGKAIISWRAFSPGPMWITLIMTMVSFTLIYTIAIPIGIVGAAKQFTIWDRITTIVPFLLYSLPSFWIGTILIAYMTGPNHWWAKATHGHLQFPTSGYYPNTIPEVGLGTWLWQWTQHLALPIACETYAGFAFLSRQMRGSLLEQIRQDFVRTARAKGLSERVVLLRHATRNALIPIVTLFGSLLPLLLGGNIIIENIFSIPGMGQLFYQAVMERNYHVLMGIETISAILTLLGILVSDILYVFVNPTISYE